MRLKITKIIGIISAVCVSLGLILVICGKIANGSFLRVFENMGGQIEYRYPEKDGDNHFDDFDGFFDNDTEDFFEDFFEGGNDDETTV